MKSAIPHTIFLLVGKTVKSLITQEIAKLIIQSVIYTGIIIGVLWGGRGEVVPWFHESRRMGPKIYRYRYRRLYFLVCHEDWVGFNPNIHPAGSKLFR